MIQLYNHQQNFVNDIRKSLIKNKSIIAVAPTGAGKTVMFSWIVSQAKGSVLIVVHRKELVRQTQATLDAFSIDRSKYRIETVQKLSRNMDFEIPSLLIVDEAHLSLSKTWMMVLQKCIDAGSYVVGFTATPCRLDGKPLGGVYRDMVLSVDTKWMINNGYLSKYEYYVPHIPNLPKVTGEYKAKDVENIMDGKVLSDAVSKYKSICDGKRVVAFCAGIDHSKLFVKQCKDSGVNAWHIDGNTPDKERQRCIHEFAEQGGILSNIELVTTGFDLAAQIGKDVTIEGVIVLRPTKSLALHRQIIGRALRKKDYSACILDMANNISTHGLPDDYIEWSLGGKTKSMSDALSIQRCPDCYHIQKPSKVCKSCGYEFKADGRLLEEIAGELVLIDSIEHQEALAKEEMTESYEELIEISKRRNKPYKWAEKQYLKNTGENLWGTEKGLYRIAEARGYDQFWVFKQMSFRRK